MLKRILLIISQIFVIVGAIAIYRWITVEPPPAQIIHRISKSLLESQSFLIRRELFIESIIKREEAGTIWGTEKKALIVTKGKVPYGLNFDRFLPSDIEVDSVAMKIHIRLPRPEIYEVIVTDIYVYDVQTGVFVDSEAYLKKLYQDVFDDARNTLRQQAQKQLTTAIDDQIKQEFVFFIGQILGYQSMNYQITVEYMQPPAGPPLKSQGNTGG